MQPDKELLRQYVSGKSEEAFAELVRRHVNLVYSAALRQAGGDAHLAHDVAQNVFTDLARKAASLLDRESLSGWLYTSAYFAANKMVRVEIRRREREERFMREPAHDSPQEADWEKLRPLLDAAMHDLRESDREAILLRYFENRPYAEVGAKFGINDNAARLRVERALEKLRTLLAKRAITTSAGLAAVISANAVQTAPPALAATISKISMTAGAGTSFALSKFMTLTHLKVGLSAVVVAGMAATMVLQNQKQQQLRSENESIHQQLAQWKADNASLSNQLSAGNDSQSSSNNQLAELLNLRAEVTQLRALKVPPVTTTAPAIDPATNSVAEAQVPTQIILRAKLVFIPNRYLSTLSLNWPAVSSGANLISEDQFETINNSMEQDGNFLTLGSPRVVTLNGREARISVTAPFPVDGTNADLGTFLNVTPHYSSTSSMVRLDFAAQSIQLVGKTPQPIFETVQLTNEINLFSGQTVILSAKMSSGVALPSAGKWTNNSSELANEPGTLLILLTPTLIDESGNRLKWDIANQRQAESGPQ